MADSSLNPVERDRQILSEAQAKGPLATLGAFVRLSGPGWLQSAITLGGGSLAGALFLGVLGGTSMLWLQLMAIVMGVVMLSAITYVTLSTGERPFGMINRHINPVLGWGWLVATSLANMIWCMPQFSLCYEALEKNLAAGHVGASLGTKLAISAVLLIIASGALLLNIRGGAMAKAFDVFLKVLIASIVLCFFGVVINLASRDMLDWGSIFSGFVPDFSQWYRPAGELRALLADLDEPTRQYWSAQLVREQRAVMIGAAATAVGINMTFLMPYSLLQRGWGRTFRGLARFDLATGMAIPYVLVTSCVVIAAAQAFHATPDPAFLSNDPEQFTASPLFGGASVSMYGRLRGDEADPLDQLADSELDAAHLEMAQMSEAEKRIAASLVRRDAFQLSQALEPLLGATLSRWIFGIGILGMGFSTIIILMLINGFVFCEAFGTPREGGLFFTGCMVAGVTGAAWPLIWDGPAKLWLAILASSFGMILLPIAYVTFFMLMNSKSVLGDDRPRGASRVVWNVLMVISVLGAFIAAATALYDKITDHSSPGAEMAGRVVLGILVLYLAAVAAGFFLKPKALGKISE